MSNKIMLLVDGGNAYNMQKGLPWRLDAYRLKEFVGQWGEIIDARYYLNIKNNEEKGAAAFRSVLSRIGYSIVPIIVKEIQSNGCLIEKANCDVRLALDAYIAHESYDMLVLVSGDSDFHYLVEVLKHRGKQVKVLCTSDMVSKELVEIVGSDFYDLNLYKRELKMLRG